MDSGRVSARYATALLQWASGNKCEYEVFLQANQLLSIIDSNSDVKSALSNNAIPNEKKQEFLIQIVNKFSPLLNRFIMLLIKMKRTASLKNALLMFMKFYRQKLGIVLAEVTCANEPSGETKKDIEEFIVSQFGNNIELSYLEDPSLIGGFIFTIDNKQVDKSIKGDLKRVEKLLLRN